MIAVRVILYLRQQKSLKMRARLHNHSTRSPTTQSEDCVTGNVAVGEFQRKWWLSSPKCEETLFNFFYLIDRPERSVVCTLLSRVLSSCSCSLGWTCALDVRRKAQMNVLLWKIIKSRVISFITHHFCRFRWRLQSAKPGFDSRGIIHFPAPSAQTQPSKELQITTLQPGPLGSRPQVQIRGNYWGRRHQTCQTSS